MSLFFMRLYLTVVAVTAPTIVDAAIVVAHVAPVLKPRKTCSTPRSPCSFGSTCLFGTTSPQNPVLFSSSSSFLVVDQRELEQ